MAFFGQEAKSAAAATKDDDEDDAAKLESGLAWGVPGCLAPILRILGHRYMHTYT